ncbi:hypothetical protein ACWDVV_30510, partial [Streptomyces tendae]
MSGQQFHGNSFGQGSTNNFGGNQSSGNTDTTQTFGDNSPVHAAPPAPSTPPAQPYADGWRRPAAA